MTGMRPNPPLTLRDRSPDESRALAAEIRFAIDAAIHRPPESILRLIEYPPTSHYCTNHPDYKEPPCLLPSPTFPKTP